MKFARLILPVDQDRAPEISVVEFGDIDMDMVLDGEYEEVLEEKAEEDGSGCDPMPVYVSLEQMLVLQERVNKVVEALKK